MADKIDRDELTLALKLATSLERDDASSGALSSGEAQRIAREVGIPPEEFRRALVEARSSRLGHGHWLGPAALLSAEASLPGESDARGAARAIAEGQAGLPQIAQGTSDVAPGIWRSSSRGTLLQVASNPLQTRVSAAANRGIFKATTILGSMVGAGFIGGQLGALLASGIMGEVSSTVAVGIAVGGVGGVIAGFFLGVSLWKASARSLQGRLYQAVDRMRDALSSDTQSEDVRAPEDASGTTDDHLT